MLNAEIADQIKTLSFFSVRKHLFFLCELGLL